MPPKFEGGNHERQAKIKAVGKEQTDSYKRPAADNILPCVSRALFRHSIRRKHDACQSVHSALSLHSGMADMYSGNVYSAYGKRILHKQDSKIGKKTHRHSAVADTKVPLCGGRQA